MTRISYGAPVTLACGCINGAARPMRMAKPEPVIASGDVRFDRAHVMQRMHDSGQTWDEVARVFGHANGGSARRFVAENYRRVR